MTRLGPAASKIRRGLSRVAVARQAFNKIVDWRRSQWSRSDGM